MHNISLHHLTISDVPCTEAIDIAAKLGLQHVCFFVKVPGRPDPYNLPRVRSRQEAQELRQRMSDRGLSAYNTDTFMNYRGDDPHAYEESLEISGALGAKVINALSFDADRAASAARLRKFADMAADHGLGVIFEWLRFSHVKTLKDAVAFLEEAGGANLSLNVDVLHLIRNDELPNDLATVDPSLKRYAQINDGPMNISEDLMPLEAIAERNFPGEGEFPLVAFVEQIPPDAVISIEAPVNRLRGTLSPWQRAERNVEGTYKILRAAGRI
jgi:sugar phosphate isomerase/epimerase